MEKRYLIGLLLPLIFSLHGEAATPAFSSFLPDQFGTAGSTVVALKPGVQITNILVSGFVMSNGVKLSFVTNLNFFGFNMTNINGLLTIVAPTSAGGGTGIATNGGSGTNNFFQQPRFGGDVTNTGTLESDGLITAIAGLTSDNQVYITGPMDSLGLQITAGDGGVALVHNGAPQNILNLDIGNGMLNIGDENGSAQVHVRTPDGLYINTFGTFGVKIFANDTSATISQLVSGKTLLENDVAANTLTLGPDGYTDIRTLSDFRSKLSITGTNGIASYCTNVVLVLDPKGYTNNSEVNMFARYGGTSGNLVYWNRSGANGQTVCGTALYTNTVIASGEVMPVPVRSGIQVVSGVGVTGSAFAQ